MSAQTGAHILAAQVVAEYPKSDLSGACGAIQHLVTWKVLERCVGAAAQACMTAGIGNAFVGANPRNPEKPRNLHFLGFWVWQAMRSRSEEVESRGRLNGSCYGTISSARPWALS